MAQGNQKLKFEKKNKKKTCNRFRDNRCHRRTDGRTNIDLIALLT